MRLLPEDKVIQTYRETIWPLFAYVSRRVGGDISIAEDFVQMNSGFSPVRVGLCWSVARHDRHDPLPISLCGIGSVNRESNPWES
jgi:hypothetical protein